MQRNRTATSIFAARRSSAKALVNRLQSYSLPGQEGHRKALLISRPVANDFAERAAELPLLPNTRLGGSEGALHIAKLPEPGPKKDYQLWIITPESKQSLDAGIIPASSECLPFSAKQPVNQVAALAISVEPKGGSVTPRGPVIYLGKL